MSERLPNVPVWEQDYWESWSDTLGIPSGTVFDSKSYNAWWAKEKQLRRQQNVSMATGRVNGRFVQGGNKR